MKINLFLSFKQLGEEIFIQHGKCQSQQSILRIPLPSDLTHSSVLDGEDLHDCLANKDVPLHNGNLSMQITQHGSQFSYDWFPLYLF